MTSRSDLCAFLPYYASDRMDAPARHAFGRHLRECAACRGDLHRILAGRVAKLAVIAAREAAEFVLDLGAAAVAVGLWFGGDLVHWARRRAGRVR